MRYGSVGLGGLFAVALGIASNAACTGGGGTAGPAPLDGGSTGDGALAANDAAIGPVGRPNEERPLVPASKIDLLLVVDNSASMGDKSAKLSTAVGPLLRDLARVGDVHVGVISSSLGNLGGDICDAVNPTTNERAYLRRNRRDGTPVPGAESGVVSFTGGDPSTFIATTEALVQGVGETGCGLEATLESMYRFLIQPDPWANVKIDGNNLADVSGEIDLNVLRDRKAFLRPDSALIVLMLTDEDDSVADPMSVGGQGWGFMSRNFPGSQVFRGASSNQGTTAARGTSVCATNPGSPDCTSCAFAAVCDPAVPACQKIKQDPNCTTSGSPTSSGPGFNGYHAPEDDSLNVRYHRMKERFGVDPQFPIQRYVDGLTKSVVPDRANEHIVTTEGGRRVIASYTGAPNCTNPIFAAELSADKTSCEAARGPRSSELVIFAVIAGVPPALATATPDWTKIVGANPDTYDLSGIDPHMVQSTVPRPGLGSGDGARGDNGSDPVHGREWNTAKQDLQYACTFALTTPRSCTSNDQSCDCTPEREGNPPLCDTGTTQIRGKAYPSIRPLRVARGLGDRGVIGSVCAPSYDATFAIINERLKTRLK